MEQQDIRLTNMQITEKANILEGLLTQAESNPEYLGKIACGDKSIAQVMAETSALIKTTKNLIINGQVGALDDDVQADTYAKFQALLDSYIKMFPEYQHEDEKTESVIQHM